MLKEPCNHPRNLNDRNEKPVTNYSVTGLKLLELADKSTRLKCESSFH
jgi:hypothetical protein